MIISIGNSIGFEPKLKKVTEVKTMEQAFNWLDSYIAKEVKAGNCHHWYTRVTFQEPDMWWLDYGSWSTFIYLTDLPEDAKEQFDIVNAKRIKEGKL